MVLDDIEKGVLEEYRKATASHQVPALVAVDHMLTVRHILGFNRQNFPAVPLEILNKFAAMIDESGMDYQKHLSPIAEHIEDERWSAWRVPASAMIGPNNQPNANLTLCCWAHGTDEDDLIGIMQDLKVRKSRPE